MATATETKATTRTITLKAELVSGKFKLEAPARQVKQLEAAKKLCADYATVPQLTDKAVAAESALAELLKDIT